MAKSRRAAGIREQRRKRKNRHHRFRTDDRHQNQRHQRARAVTGEAADHRGNQRHRRDETELGKGDFGKTGRERFEHEWWRGSRPLNPRSEASAS